MLLRKSPIAFFSLLFLLSSHSVFAASEVEVRKTDDYLALTFEAEDFSDRNERWVVTDPTTPAQENDPDPNHSDGAVGKTYLELLPDMRVKHGDSLGPPAAYWDEPGTGPKVSYSIDFPEAGRYYVHLRALSTGTEDNGIHIGINETWPASGARMQFCSAGRGWTWSGRQRDSGGAGSCGVQKTIWLTVEEAGIHTVQISAREDGFEADRLMLIKDLSDNTRICKPANENDINCVNGSLENVDEVVDMAVDIEADDTMNPVDIKDTVSFSVVVRNLDGYDKADDVELVLDLQVGTRWKVLSKNDLCEVNEANKKLECALGAVSPSGPEREEILDFVLMPLQSGYLPVPVVVSTSSIDGKQSNDAAQIEVEVTDVGSLSTLTVSWVSPPASVSVGAESRLVAMVGNTGPAEATEASFTVSLATGLKATSLPSGCSGVDEIVCAYQSFAAEHSETLEFGITPEQIGLVSVSIMGTATNLDGEMASASVVLDVKAEQKEVEKVEQEGTTSGSDTGGQQSAASNTDSSTGSTGLLLLTLLLITLLLKAQESLVPRSSRELRRAHASAYERANTSLFLSVFHQNDP